MHQMIQPYVVLYGMYSTFRLGANSGVYRVTYAIFRALVNYSCDPYTNLLPTSLKHVI